MRAGFGNNLPPLEQPGWTEEEAALTVIQNEAFQALQENKWNMRWGDPTKWEGKAVTPQQKLQNGREITAGVRIAMVPLKNLASQDKPHPYAVSYINEHGEVEHFPPEAHIVMANDHLGDDDVMILEARSRPGRPGHLLYWERVENQQTETFRQSIREKNLHHRTVPADHAKAYSRKIDQERMGEQLRAALPGLRSAVKALLALPENQNIELHLPEDQGPGFLYVQGKIRGDLGRRPQLEKVMTQMATVIQTAVDEVGGLYIIYAIDEGLGKSFYKIAPAELPLKQ